MNACMHTLTYTNEMIMMSMQLLLSPCSLPSYHSQLFTRHYITPHVKFISPFCSGSSISLSQEKNKRENFISQGWGGLWANCIFSKMTCVFGEYQPQDGVGGNSSDSKIKMKSLALSIKYIHTFLNLTNF